jgi:WD40 repeat protein
MAQFRPAELRRTQLLFRLCAVIVLLLGILGWTGRAEAAAPVAAAGTTDEALAGWLAKNGRATTLTFSHDGRLLVVGTSRGRVVLWDLAKAVPRRVFRGPGARVWSTDLSQDGSRVVSAGADRVVRLWEVASGKEARSWSCGRTHDLLVRFAPDGTRVLGGGFQLEVRVWDVRTGKLLHRCFNEPLSTWEQAMVRSFPGRKVEDFRSGEGHVRCLAFLSSRQVLIGGDGGQRGTGHMLAGSSRTPGPYSKALRWDIDTGKEPVDCVAGIGEFLAVAVSPDGRLLACGWGGEDPLFCVNWFEVSVHDLTRKGCSLLLRQLPSRLVEQRWHSSPAANCAFAI